MCHPVTIKELSRQSLTIFNKKEEIFVLIALSIMSQARRRDNLLSTTIVCLLVSENPQQARNASILTSQVYSIKSNES